jgi:hypothetical protein
MTNSVLRRRSFVCGVSAIAAAPALARQADALSPPAAKPILTISGNIGESNDGKLAQFDRALLEGLGTARFTTATPWYKQPMEFEGVPLDRIMQAVAAKGDRIRALALDDYASELPISDFSQYATLLALKVGGQYIGVSDKGPCFIIYPFDRFSDTQNATFYHRSVWQVTKIVVL